MRGDLVGQEIAVRGQLHQAQSRARVVQQQRQIGRAGADGLQHAQQTAQRRQRLARGRRRRHQHRQQCAQAPTADGVEPLHERQLTKIQQQLRGATLSAKPAALQPRGQRRPVGLVELRQAPAGASAGAPELAPNTMARKLAATWRRCDRSRRAARSRSKIHRRASSSRSSGSAGSWCTC
jgi:hypothetical protein